MPLTADDIRRAFTAYPMSSSAVRSAPTSSSSAVRRLFCFSAREKAPKMLNAFFLPPEPSIVRAAAEAVAGRLDLPGDWLNDGAKAYLVTVTTGDTIYESAALTVRAATMPQLLAMKLAAWRDAIDRADAKLLLAQMSGGVDEIRPTIRPFLPPRYMASIRCRAHSNAPEAAAVNRC